MRTFDPLVVGRAECAVWVAYYRREWVAFLRSALTMVRGGFGLSWPRTVQGAWWVLRANQAWAPYPGNDPDAARGYMRRFYALVARVHAEPIDPVRASTLEVEWWRVHRALQREDGARETVDDLAGALARLYAYVYRVPEDAVARAARLRADAMVTSDAWVRAGCDPDDRALVREEEQLVTSYAALRAAVGPPGT